MQWTISRPLEVARHMSLKILSIVVKLISNRKLDHHTSGQNTFIRFQNFAQNFIRKLYERACLHISQRNGARPQDSTVSLPGEKGHTRSWGHRNSWGRRNSLQLFNCLSMYMQSKLYPRDHLRSVNATPISQILLLNDRFTLIDETTYYKLLVLAYKKSATNQPD